MTKLKYFCDSVTRVAFPKNCAQKAICILHALFISNQHKQHFYKQRQAEFGKKTKQELSNTGSELLLFENYLLFSSILSSKKQGVQAFTFCVVIVNDEHTKSRFKLKPRVKYKDGICVELCLSL